MMVIQFSLDCCELFQKLSAEELSGALKGQGAASTELVLMEKQESGLEVTFHGLYTVALPTTLPGYIEIEK